MLHTALVFVVQVVVRIVGSDELRVLHFVNHLIQRPLRVISAFRGIPHAKWKLALSNICYLRTLADCRNHFLVGVLLQVHHVVHQDVGLVAFIIVIYHHTFRQQNYQTYYFLHLN